jgi:hypothetical protein
VTKSETRREVHRLTRPASTPAGRLINIPLRLWLWIAADDAKWEDYMSLHSAAWAIGAFGVCVAIAVSAQYVTKSTAQNPKVDQPQAGSEAAPIYGVTIPAGYATGT